MRDAARRAATAGGRGRKRQPYAISARELEDRAASAMATAGVLMAEAVRLYAEAAVLRERERMAQEVLV